MFEMPEMNKPYKKPEAVRELKQWQIDAEKRDFERWREKKNQRWKNRNDPKVLIAKEIEARKRIISRCNSELTAGLDKLEYILQGDVTPVTAGEFLIMGSIKTNIQRAVRLACEIGIDAPKIWEVFHCRTKNQKRLANPHIFQSKCDEAKVIEEPLNEN